MDFGCTNCDDAMKHALMHNTNPFIDTFYNFCNSCNNPTAKLKFERWKELERENNDISSITSN